MKLSITIEDTADGGVFITGTPSIEELRHAALDPAKLTSAQGYAMEAWIALRACAAQAQRNRGATFTAWDDGSTH